MMNNVGVDMIKFESNNAVLSTSVLEVCISTLLHLQAVFVVKRVMYVDVNTRGDTKSVIVFVDKR